MAPSREQGIGQEATLHDTAFWGLGRVGAEVKEILVSEGDREGVAARAQEGRGCSFSLRQADLPVLHDTGLKTNQSQLTQEWLKSFLVASLLEPLSWSGDQRLGIAFHPVIPNL